MSDLVVIVTKSGEKFIGKAQGNGVFTEARQIALVRMPNNPGAQVPILINPTGLNELSKATISFGEDYIAYIISDLADTAALILQYKETDQEEAAQKAGIIVTDNMNVASQLADLTTKIKG